MTFWLIILGVAVAVGLGQWFVTRPAKSRQVDTGPGRAQIEARYGKDPTRYNDAG